MVRKKKQEAGVCKLRSNLLILTGASWKGWHWIHSKMSADEQLHVLLGTLEYKHLLCLSAAGTTSKAYHLDRGNV